LPNKVNNELCETVDICNYKTKATYLGKMVTRGNSILRATLISRGKYLSQIEIAIHCNIQLPQLDTVIDLSKHMSMKLAQTHLRKVKYLNPPVFSFTDRPLLINKQYIMYGEVKPVNDTYGHIGHLQNFLYAKHLVAVAVCSDYTILMLPNSSLTREWGITSRKHPMQLHALLCWKEADFNKHRYSRENTHSTQQHAATPL